MGKVLTTFGPPAERRRRFIIKFEDADMADMHFICELEATARWDRLKDHWTCTLFGTWEIDG